MQSRFPQSGVVAYVVACLSGALGREREAKAWLALALGRAGEPEKLMTRARQQSELVSLWRNG